MDRGRLRRLRRRASCRWARRRTNGATAIVEAGFKNAALVLDETVRDARTRITRRSSRARRWPTGQGEQAVHAQRRRRARCRPLPRSARWMRLDPSNVVLISEYTGGGFGSKATGVVSCDDSGAALEESQRAGDDAHQPRGRAVRSADCGPALHGRIKAGFDKDGRILAHRHARHRREQVRTKRPATAARPARIVSLAVSAAAMRNRWVTILTQHAAASRAESAGWTSGPHVVRASARQGRTQAGHRSGRASTPQRT